MDLNSNLKKNAIWIYVAIFASALLILFADIQLPLGVAVWIFYFVPVVLTLFVTSPSLPYIAWLVCSAFVILAFFFAPPGQDATVALTNRIFKIVGLFVISSVVQRVIVSRNSIQKQSWLRNGQMLISQKMHGEQSVTELSRNVLTFLCDYLGAVAGVIYVFDGKNSYQLTACVGVQEELVPTQFKLGEDIVGQAAVDKRLRVMFPFPSGFLNIKTGLGRGKPETLIVAPFEAETIVKAVVELGFLERPDPAIEDFLKQISDVAGIAIRSARFRYKLEQTLEETQRQSEELQSQQEELRVINEELEEQKRELSRASKYKSEFLANMSHELRTPLNSALIFSKLLADNEHGNLTEEQVEYAKAIYGSGNDLLNLINDILDLSKVEAGKLEVHAETIGVAEFAEKISRQFKVMAQQKGLSFEIDIQSNVPKFFSTDPLRLEQILNNLLSNAIKFTPQGSVKLSISSQNQKINFSVEDTGIGIPQELHEIIFEAFRQGESTTTRRFGGTGLGLSICRKLSELLGGSIEVRSEPNHGSTFALTLPLHTHFEGGFSKQREERAPQMKLPVQRERREEAFVTTPSRSSDRLLLIIEDDKAFSRVLVDVAHNRNFECLVAETAEQGFALAQEHLPNAILLDIRLPDHTGLTVLDRLKNTERTRHIPVHVISVDDLSATALRMGAAGYELKPIKYEQLINTFEKLESHLQQEQNKILIVEDDPTQRNALCRLLESRNVKASGVGSAREAREFLTTERFDCIVVDLGLPDMSGFEFLEHLSKEEVEKRPPVIVYTGRELSRDEEQDLRKRARSIIIKGAKSPERLLSEVNLFLHRVESDLPEHQRKLLQEMRVREKAFDGRKILLADDDVRNIFALTSVLEKKGAKVVIARDGRECLNRLEENPDTGLVLMDIMMPVMDGYEAMSAMRSHSKFKDIPIIAVTAKSMKDDQIRSLQAGANDFIAKPVDVEKLLSLMRVWLVHSDGI